MIRFINLKGQIYLDDSICFAFYNTVNDRFCTFNESQVWDSIDEFAADYEGNDLKRFISLIPGDVLAAPRTV